MKNCWIWLVLLSCVSPLMAADDWPQFRGPDGDGHSDAVGVPLNWSEQEHVTWKTPIPGSGWSSPVILGNQIWFTTALNDGKSLRAICVDRTLGDIVHNLELFTPQSPPHINAKNSHASPTAVIEPGRVYVCFGSTGTACIDTQTGMRLWENTELRVDHQEGAGSSPILFGDLLLLNCDGIDVRYFAALDKHTGKIQWKRERSGPLNPSADMRKAFSVPLVIQVSGRDQAISPAADRVIAYNPATGEEDWVVRYSGFSNVPRPIFGNGLIYVCTGYMSPQLWAIRAGGKGDITETHVAWKVTKQVPANPSPILVGDELYMVSDKGVATCLDAQSGKTLWNQRFGGDYWGSPVAVDGRIYFFDEQGRTTVIKPGKQYEPLTINQLDGGFMASPAIAGKAFFLRTTTHLYRIE